MGPQQRECVLATGVGDGHAGICGTHGERHTGYHFKWDALLVQKQRLLGATAKQEGIPQLQASDEQSVARLVGDEHRDCVLRHRAFGRRAHFQAFGVVSREREQSGDVAIVDDHVGVGEYAQPARGEQTRIAGTGADENNASSSGGSRW